MILVTGGGGHVGSRIVRRLVNLVAATVALIILIIAERPTDESHPWGHEKAMYFSSGLEGIPVYGIPFWLFKDIKTQNVFFCSKTDPSSFLLWHF